MDNKKATFYIATSYEQKERANKLARALMDRYPFMWPSFPWWMYSAEEDKHDKHMGAVGELEIIGAAEADNFIWLYPARKGAWCELGAACYRRVVHKNNKIVMVIPESAASEYLPPFAYQHGVTRFIVPDHILDSPIELAELLWSMCVS